MVNRLSISFSLSAPTLAMAVCWTAMFLNPNLGFSETLKPIFITLLLLSWLGCIAGIIYFFITQNSWHVISCLAISLLGIALNVYGFLFAIGAVTSAFM